jgi:ceramide glucosyltransferase
MVACVILGILAGVSLCLTLWQCFEACGYPIHRRTAKAGFAPSLSILKPLKGTDAETEACLRSWLAQDYAGPLQLLFGVAAPDDPVVAVVERLRREFPNRNTELVVCSERLGWNAKVSKLTQLQLRARYDTLVVSDADVFVPADFLASLVADFTSPEVGVVNPLYALASPHTLAMRWEALGVNADFWSNVLMSRRLGPMRFALGAVIALRRADLDAIGGFAAFVNHLADDYEIGRRVTARGLSVAICPVVVECREAEQGWRAVWRHQLRWSRTIRVCRPVGYAASIVSNATLWPLLWLAVCPDFGTAVFAGGALAARILTALVSQRRLTRSWAHLSWFWLAPVKDALQVALWLLAFTGHKVEWRGERYRVQRNGELVPVRN